MRPSVSLELTDCWAILPFGWAWKTPNPRNENEEYETIGFVGGHVDDFCRAGKSRECEQAYQLRQQIQGPRTN